jgi:hypothetical protein
MALSKIQAESMNLADTFAFTGTVSGAGSFNLVTTNTISSAVNNVEFSGIDDTYKIYCLLFNNMQLDGDGGVGMLLGDSSSMRTANYRGTGFESIANTTAVNGFSSTSSSRMTLSSQHYGFGGDTLESAHGVIWIYNLRGTSGHKTVIAQTAFVEGGNFQANSYYVGRLYETTAFSKIQIGNIGGSANVDTGTFSLYGVSQ